ncbi:MAG TPA: hypothetical protein GX739_05180 [Firmicutes bacterium]|nr:hypothetical protein [Bacillota bacterium]
MFDTNIFDKLIIDQFFPDIWQAAASGLLTLVTCEIQEQEIAGIKDPRKRRLIQSIPRQVVPSKAVDREQLPPIPDLIIAHTAAASCDLLVTEDRQLQQWYQQYYTGKPCFDYQQFISWFLENILA